MNKTLKTVLIIIGLIAVVIIYGCVRNHISEVQRKNYKLNARQVAILKEEEMTFINYEDILVENIIDVFFSIDTSRGRHNVWDSERE